VAPVTLTVVCFRFGDLAMEIAQAVQLGGEAFLTSTMLGGRPVLRACILHRDTTEADVEALVAAERQAGRALACGADT
jgi:aromatic-L-amino-acid decarboxylase